MTYNFNNVADAYGINNVPLSKIYGSGDLLLWEKNSVTPPDPDDYSRQPLGFEFLEGGTWYWRGIHTSESPNWNQTIYYKLNDGDWTPVNSWDNTIVNVQAGDKMKVKGNLESCCNPNHNRITYNKFSGTAKYNVYGNIMSLLYGDTFINVNVLPTRDTFYLLFNDTNVVDASNLILPATVLTAGCYMGMFRNCHYLIAAPNLPATTLAGNCYEEMFYNCSELTTAPDLLAIQLQPYCYFEMFTLCTKLNYIKCLARNLPSVYSEWVTWDWVSSVAANGTFVKSAGSNIWSYGANGIPRGWTVVNAS